jgi:hypothetical protein
MASCMATARENPAIIKVGASEAEIHAYCDCAMSEFSKTITAEEVIFYTEHDDFPASAYTKIHPIMAACGQTHFFN